MKLSDYDYKLPDGLIAKNPTKPRDHSRLLVYDAKSRKIKHHIFYEIIDLLEAGDVLVVNESKVFPARLFGKRKDTGGKIEILLSKPITKTRWEALGKNIKKHIQIIFGNSDLTAKVININDGFVTLEFNKYGTDLFLEFEKIGSIPLPPYIKKKVCKEDKKNYQTIFAKNVGSIAAPTAGLHFTKKLLKKIENKKINIIKITLHVGLGTFASIKEEDFTKHKIHKEYYEVNKKSYDQIIQAKENKKRIIAVGTTTTRVLEHLFSKKAADKSYSGWTDIFIYPGYKFKCIDGLITNLHLPKSSLLLLVSAFTGSKNIKRLYKEAIANNYRFYSYGDAMFLVN